MSEGEYQVQFRFGNGMTPMVKRILIITLCVSGGILILSLFSMNSAGFLNSFFGLIPAKGLLGFQIWRFVTYAFVHSFTDPFHLLFNMLALFFFGPDLERWFSSQKQFLSFYLAAALFGGILQSLFSLGSPLPIIGASASVFAIIVASAVITPNRMVILFIFPLKLKYLAILFVGMNFLYAFRDLQGAHIYVAYIAHLGGAAFGFLCIKGMPYFEKMKQDIRIRQKELGVEKEQNEEEELDRLLAKVHDEGLGSLSSKEREFLMKKSSDYSKKRS